MGCIPYQRVADAQQCLQNTIVLFRGLPHQVINVSGRAGVVNPHGITVHLMSCPIQANAQPIDCRLDDPNLDISNMRLGFVNDNNNAYWFTRYPHRGNAQGLSDANTATFPVTRFGDEPRRDLTRLVGLPGFLSPFNGNYPTVKAILRDMAEDKKIRSRAFHRLFAISRDEFRGDFIVHYKQDKVGFGHLSDQKINLTKDYLHLKEQFTECGFDVAC